MSINYSTVSENRWLKLIDYPITNNFHRIVFTVILGVISVVGGLTNLFIIAINVMHKMRYFREFDYYSAPSKYRNSSMNMRLSGMNRPSTQELTVERKSIYFDALSSHGRFRYSHVILALSIFHLCSSLIFIPILGIHVCADIDIDIINDMILISMSWMPFQVLFISAFLSINTSIQFFSICYPLRFRLKRSPLLISFIIIIIICIGHSISCKYMIWYELFSLFDLILLNISNPEVVRTKYIIEIALTIPFAFYCVTGICTVYLYMAIIHSINFGHHLAVVGASHLEAIGEVEVSNFSRTEDYSRRWNRIVKRNLQNLFMLATTTTIFYISEIPIFLVQYDHVRPKYWTLISHCSVHLTCPMSHIILSKQFKKAALEIIKLPHRTAIEYPLKQFAVREMPSIYTNSHNNENS